MLEVLIGLKNSVLRTQSKKAVGFFVLTRLFCLGAIVVVALARHRGINYPHESLGQALSVFDGNWYDKVARSWYPHAVCAGPKTVIHPCSLGFFPILPAILALFHFVGIPFVITGQCIDLVCGVVVVVLIEQLVSSWMGEGTGLRTAMLFAVYPMAVVLSLTYTEALFSLCAIGGLYALSENRWLLASCAIALATLTRPTGVLLVVVCIAVWFGDRSIRRAMPAVIGAATFFGWLTYLWLWTGSPLAYFTSQRRGWGVYFDFGKKNLIGAIHAIGDPFGRPIVTLGTVFLAVALCSLIWMWISNVPWMWCLYATLLVGAAVGTHNTLSAVPRLALPAFPMLVPLAMLMGKWPIVMRRIAFGAALVGMTGISVYVVFFSSYPP